jgi:hypothetical protein
MKVLLTLYGDETAFVDSSPEYIAREMAAWQEFDEAARAAGVVIACDAGWRVRIRRRRCACATGGAT